MLRTALFLACITLASCGPDKTKTIVSKEEAQAAAKKLEAIVKDGNGDAFIAFMDLPSLFAIVTEKSRAAKSATFMKGFKSTYTGRGYTETIIKSIRKRGSFLLLRNYEKDGRRRLLFRLVSPEGITYHDFLLIKKGNAIKAEDVFSYTTGEDLTTTLADMIDSMVPDESGGKEVKRLADSLSRLKDLEINGEDERVKESYGRLPEAMQQTRSLMLIYINACHNTDKGAYKTALEKFCALFPSSPSSYLLLIDAYIEQKDYKKALFAVDKINEIMGEGGDPYLDFYKGRIHMRMEDFPAAKAYFEKVYAFDPEWDSNLGALIELYLRDNEIDKVKKLIAAYKTSKIFNQAELDALYEKVPALQN